MIQVLWDIRREIYREMGVGLNGERHRKRSD